MTDIDPPGQPQSSSSTPSDGAFLPGVPVDLCRLALAAAGGNEIESGKLLSPESSAALAVNTFGWFIERPTDLPPFPVLPDAGWPAVHVSIERQMRFPWSGGRHPWLDAAVETAETLIGVESKRFEPFRDKKTASLSAAYDREVWGDAMEPYTVMRDRLRQEEAFKFLDAVQLVKHAFGLVTEGNRIGKRPVLLYLFAEPSHRGEKAIPAELIERHRREVAEFASAVRGASVEFAACSYRDWLAHWPSVASTHRETILSRFNP